jgi:hypothetical protein
MYIHIPLSRNKFAITFYLSLTTPEGGLAVATTVRGDSPLDLQARRLLTHRRFLHPIAD